MQENTPPHLAFDQAWFEKFQNPLLFLLNAKLTRRLTRRFFAIREYDCPIETKIDKIAPNRFTYGTRQISEELEERTTDFRTHAKFSKRVYFILKPLWWTMHFWDELFADHYAPRLSFGFSTLTAYPDAGTGATTVDGLVSREIGRNESFASIIGSAGDTVGASDTAVGVALRCSATTNQFDLNRRWLGTFDTQTLGSGATISSAILSLYGSGTNVNNIGSLTVGIVSSNPAANNNLQNSDYSTLGSTAFAEIINASWNSSAYNDFTLDSNGITNVSKTGISKFGAKHKWDYDANFTGSWQSGSVSIKTIYTADQTGTSNDPKLVITYTAPTAWTQTCSETLTLTASNVNQAGKVSSETITLTPSVVSAAGRAISETVTLTASLLNQPGKFCEEAITITVSTLATTAREISETVSLTATIISQTSREFVDSFSLTDVVTALKVSFLELIDSLNLTDTIFRTVTKLSEEILTLTDSITSAIGHSFEEILTLTATAANQIAKTLSETITTTTSQLITSGKVISETLTITATLTTLRVAYKSLTESVSLSDILGRSIYKILTETVSFTDKCKKYLNGINMDWRNKFTNMLTNWYDKYN